MSFNTTNGYNYFEAMSSFQKAIRRCDEDESVFWAIEFFESNLESHLWTRIFIIIQEDIGLAEPEMNMRIWSMKKSYDFLAEKRPKKISKRLAFLNIIITLARAKKSRYIDMAYMKYWSLHQERAKNHKIPEYAYDMHTYKGKKMGHGIEHFYSEGAKINNTEHPDGTPIVPGEIELKQEVIEIEKELSKKPNKPKPKPKPDLFNG